MALTTVDINHLIEPFEKLGIFKGVFACDNLPNFITLPAAFVINLSKKNSNGSHWVGLFIDCEGFAEYFDSFGFPPLEKNIAYYIRRHSQKMRYNKKQLQHLVSNKCGKNVILFILCKMYNKNFDEILARFSNNLGVNEIIIENIMKYFNEKRRELIYKTY